LAEQVLTAVFQNPTIARSQPHTAARRRFLAEQISEAVNALVAVGKVHSEMQAAGGRHAEVFVTTANKQAPRS